MAAPLVIQTPLTCVSVWGWYVLSMWAFSASFSLSEAKGKATSNLPLSAGSLPQADGRWGDGRQGLRGGVGQGLMYIDRAWKKSVSLIRVMKRCGPIVSEPGVAGVGSLRRTT